MSEPREIEEIREYIELHEKIVVQNSGVDSHESAKYRALREKWKGVDLVKVLFDRIDKLEAALKEAVSSLEKIGCLGFRAKREECTCFRCKGLTNLEEALK